MEKLLKNNKIFIIIAFALSFVISLTIVAHSTYYLATNLVETSEIIIAFFSILLIEIGFIFLPYMAAKEENPKWIALLIDIALIILLFFMSIIPATLQTSDHFREQIVQSFSQEPEKPSKSTSISLMNNEISSINGEIIQYNTQKQLMIAQQFITKSQGIDIITKELRDRKIFLSDKIFALESEYSKKLANYKTALTKYTLEEKRKSFNSYFDYLKLTWILFLIMILQLVNGRFILYGSKMIHDNLHNMVEDFDEDINKTDIETRPITFKDLLKFRVVGVGETSIKKFLEKMNIETDLDLNNFLFQEEFSAPIFKQFPKETAKRLNRFCTKIKKSILEGKVI